jgi:hypothetical protein
MTDESRDSKEYLDASENLRHEANVFFANATVFSTITGALLAFLYYKQPPPTPGQQLSTYLAGILTATCFWIAAEVFLYRGHWFMKRAADLEAQLGYNQYSGMLERTRRFRPSSWGWRALFGSVTGFWIFSTLSHFHIGSAVAAAVAVVLPSAFQLVILRGSRVPN